jgi:hypothetical protein
MVILPIDNKEKAKVLLNQAIADKFTITMLVLGDGQGEDQIASKADIRAMAFASTRRVVWVRDVSIIPDDKIQLYRNGRDDAVVCTLNLDDEPVVHLDRNEANSFLTLERAFLKAEHG